MMLIVTLFGFTSRSHAQTVQEWSEPINLSRSGVASQPSLVVDSQGVLHVFWLDRFEGYKYVESPDGVTWSAPVALQFPFSVKQPVQPVFMADPKGIVHIFWLSERNELLYSQASDENLDTPAAWLSRSTLDNAVLDFDINMDAQGRLHLGYIKNPVLTSSSGETISPIPISDTAGVFHRYSIDGGRNWASRTLLYESAYFRALTLEQARIRIATTDEKVYAVWDDQPQKRIFMATSTDAGLSWNPAKELITPQASLSYKTPYHADIEASPERLLVTWQVGEPGVQCTPYSSVSSDHGESWEEPVQILAGYSGCPEKSEFLPMDPAYSVVLFTLQGNLSMSAWNGTQWSNPEPQTGPSAITNPATFDPVTLGCHQAQARADLLFVVGCAQDSGGDIWFISRQLDPLENLFPLPSTWGKDTNITAVNETITSLSSVTDAANKIHAFWIKSSAAQADPVDPSIDYSRWDGEEWTKPSSVITDLPGFPLNLTLQMDSHQRLLLSWIDQSTGELLFSWANSEQANLPVEWIPPVVISSSSQLTNSPDMLIDASDRILIAYAITLNEKRGVYILQSSDLGVTWSPPILVFDALAANWDMVDQPKLAVTEDGKLHILFTQYTLLGAQQALGLHYSQSADGGFTWTNPQMVNSNPVAWSEIAAFKQVLHRFWQENDRSVISTYHQVSSDGGMTWSPAGALRSEINMVSEPSISLSGSGRVHLLQVVKDESYIFQEWDWSGERAQLIESRKLGLAKENSDIGIESGITSQGVIYALIQHQKPRSINEMETSILNIGRSLELTEGTQPLVASISTPAAVLLSTQDPELQLTPTLAAPLVPIDDTQSETIKDIVGLALIVSIVLVLLFFMIPRRNKSIT